MCVCMRSHLCGGCPHTCGHMSSLTRGPCLVHARPHNIISRNIISHIAVMTLGRYVDYTVANSSPADWVSILPYITSPHSSSCARAHVCVSVCERAFLLPSFFQITSHFPQFPRRCSRRCGLQVMWSNMKMGRQNNALTIKRRGWGRRLVEGEKKKVLKKNVRAAACCTSGCKSAASCSFGGEPSKRERSG